MVRHNQRGGRREPESVGATLCGRPLHGRSRPSKGSHAGLPLPALVLPPYGSTFPSGTTRSDLASLGDLASLASVDRVDGCAARCGKRQCASRPTRRLTSGMFATITLKTVEAVAVSTHARNTLTPAGTVLAICGMICC